MMRFKLTLIFLICLPFVKVQGQSLPIVGLELGKHSDELKGFHYFQKNKLLATVSRDKSLRVWEMPGYRLLSVVRMPEDAGEFGSLKYCSFHPDSLNIVVVGGKIGMQRPDARIQLQNCYSFYVVDWKLKRVIDKIGAFNSEVSRIKFSPDGKILAVAAEREEVALYWSNSLILLKNEYLNDEEIVDIFFVDDSIFYVVTDIFIREYMILKEPAGSFATIRLQRKMRQKSSACCFDNNEKKLLVYDQKFTSGMYWKKGWKMCVDMEQLKCINKEKYSDRHKFNQALSKDYTQDFWPDEGQLLYRDKKKLEINLSSRGDSLYIGFSGEPLRCMIYPFRLKEVDWRLPSYDKGKEERISREIYHTSTLGEWMIAHGQGIKLSNGDALYWEDNVLSRTSALGSYYECFLPSNITQGIRWINEQYILLTTSDGVIRWYAVEDGREVLALFITESGEWIYWTPEGYYYSDKPSNAGLIELRQQKYMNVIVRKLEDVRANYYNKEFVYDRLQMVYGLIGKEGKSTGKDFLKLQNILAANYPEIRIDKVLLENRDKGELVTVIYTINNYNRDTYGYSEVKLEVDQVGWTIGNHVKTSEGGIIEALIPEGSSRILLGLWGDNSLITYDKCELDKYQKIDFRQIRGVLFGVSDYDIWGIPSLKSPVNDVNDFSAYICENHFTQQEKELPLISKFLNREVTRESVFDTLKAIKKVAGQQDLTLFYFSGHAFTTSANEYVLLPYGLKNMSEIHEKGIGVEHLLELLDSIPGYKIIILDACYSGKAVKDTHKNMAIFTSSRQDQVSLDGNELSGSVFTRILLAGLKQGIQTGHGGIALKDIKEYLIRNINEETDGKQQTDFSIDPLFENCVIIKKDNYEN